MGWGRSLALPLGEGHQRSCALSVCWSSVSRATSHHLKFLSRKHTPWSEVFRALTAHRWDTETWRGLGTCLRSCSWLATLLEQCSAVSPNHPGQNTGWGGQERPPTSPPVTGGCCKLMGLMAKFRPNSAFQQRHVCSRQSGYGSAVLMSYLIYALSTLYWSYKYPTTQSFLHRTL